MADPKQAALNKQFQEKFANYPWYKKLPVAATDLSRTLLDDATFGFLDKGVSLMTGRNEGAITEAIRSRMSGADIPGAIGLGMLTPTGTARAVGYMGGGPIARHLVGGTVGAAEGAAQGALSAAGHDQDMAKGAAFGAAAFPVTQAIVGPLSAGANKIAKWWKGAKDELPPPSLSNTKEWNEQMMPPPGHTEDYYKSRQYVENDTGVSRPDLPHYWEPDWTTTLSPKTLIEDAATNAKEAGGRPYDYHNKYQELLDNPATMLGSEELKLVKKITQPPPVEEAAKFGVDVADNALQYNKLMMGIPQDVEIMNPLNRMFHQFSGHNIMDSVEAARRHALDIPKFEGPISPVMQGQMTKGIRRGMLSRMYEDEQNPPRIKVSPGGYY